jgi:hypothetical protein
LTNATSHILNPFDISDDTFSGIPSSTELSVPKGTKSKYEAAAGWTMFQGGIVEVDMELQTGNGDANGDDEVTVTDAVDTINYILGGNTYDFSAAAVDMNGDGIVTVTDIILLMIACSLLP